jgi:hypothetical protein
MLRIPELAHPAIADTPQRAAARRAPVRREDGLPHDEYIQLAVGLARQQIFGCGGPPQARRSSRGQQKNEPRHIRFCVESFREFCEVSL